MAATILNSPEAVAMSVFIVRAFVQMREALTANAAILKRLAEIDKSLMIHDVALRDVYKKLLPLPVDRVLTALLWVWFVNLFNFMDGIDGITAVETITISGGLAAISALAFHAPLGFFMAAAPAAAALGFLYWNWAPSRIFLGVVGSVPLGYLLGGLLVFAAANGLWATALILPLYYLADASWTLGRRALRRGPLSVSLLWLLHRPDGYGWPWFPAMHGRCFWGHPRNLQRQCFHKADALNRQVSSRVLLIIRGFGYALGSHPDRPFLPERHAHQCLCVKWPIIAPRWLV
jgi:UDP-N-acetylmuramyl pentapeptide phosphotransferase/UDP-N-acetylglucosamine-1-phosphate transferase